MIFRTVLIACERFDGQGAARVGAAIARGLAAGGWEADVCPLEEVSREDLPASLHAVDFDARMRRARAVVVAPRHIPAPGPTASAALEIASRARQAGVPAYAVTQESSLDLFQTRMFDLQLVLQATGSASLRTAGRRLAEVI